MNQPAGNARERYTLVATNPMRIAGLQGVYGDPCGIELIPVSLSEALCRNLDRNQQSVTLIDAGSISPLFEALSKFRKNCPRAQLIVIGTDADDTYIECVISAGARGFIPATAPCTEFMQALDTVREGSIWAPRKVLSRLIGRRYGDRSLTASDGTAGVPLTPREGEVLKLLLVGHGNREIATHLGIDPNTVKAHLGRIMRKAGVGNRVELTMYALDRRPGHPVNRSTADRRTDH